MSFVGLSGFALQNKSFPTEKFIKIFRGVKRPGTAVLWSTFGNSTDGIGTFCDSVKNRSHALEIHLSNEAGRRNQRLFQGEFLKQLTVKEYNQRLENERPRLERSVKRRVDTIRRKLLDVTNENTTIYLSIGLEHQFTKAARRVLLRWCTEAWPEVLLVNNPGANRVIRGGDLLELHGLTPKLGRRRDESIVNLDGVSVNVGDGETYNPRPGTSISVPTAARYLRDNRRSEVRLLWSASSQGFRDGSFRPPRRRDFIITNKAVREFNKLLKSV